MAREVLDRLLAEEDDWRRWNCVWDEYVSQSSNAPAKETQRPKICPPFPSLASLYINKDTNSRADCNSTKFSNKIDGLPPKTFSKQNNNPYGQNSSESDQLTLNFDRDLKLLPQQDTSNQLPKVPMNAFER